MREGTRCGEWEEGRVGGRRGREEREGGCSVLPLEVDDDGLG